MLLSYHLIPRDTSKSSTNAKPVATIAGKRPTGPKRRTVKHRRWGKSRAHGFERRIYGGRGSLKTARTKARGSLVGDRNQPKKERERPNLWQEGVCAQNDNAREESGTGLDGRGRPSLRALAFNVET